MAELCSSIFTTFDTLIDLDLATLRYYKNSPYNFEKRGILTPLLEDEYTDILKLLIKEKEDENPLSSILSKEHFDISAKNYLDDVYEEIKENEEKSILKVATRTNIAEYIFTMMANSQDFTCAVYCRTDNEEKYIKKLYKDFKSVNTVRKENIVLNNYHALFVRRAKDLSEIFGNRIKEKAIYISSLRINFIINSAGMMTLNPDYINHYIGNNEIKIFDLYSDYLKRREINE